MNEEEFMTMVEVLADYLAEQKVFVQNPQRMAEVNTAMEIACRLFPDSTITIEDDPLQMGGVILCIEDFDIAVRETEAFVQLISNANNFEIYTTGKESVKIAILFAGALTLI